MDFSACLEANRIRYLRLLLYRGIKYSLPLKLKAAPESVKNTRSTNSDLSKVGIDRIFDPLDLALCCNGMLVFYPLIDISGYLPELKFGGIISGTAISIDLTRETYILHNHCVSEQS